MAEDEPKDRRVCVLFDPDPELEAELQMMYAEVDALIERHEAEYNSAIERFKYRMLQRGLPPD